MFKEFKEFAMKGNLIDMAVGLVMGAAFATVTGAFIEGLFMPLVGMIFQTGDLSKAAIELAPAVMSKTDPAKVEVPANMFMYGRFIAAVINFIIVAFVMFMVIKGMNKMKKAEAEAPAPPPPPTETLLAEIRDLLAKR